MTETYVTEVYGEFGGYAGRGWHELRHDDCTEADARRRCEGLTSHHYRAARVLHAGKVVFKSGAEVDDSLPAERREMAKRGLYPL